MACRLGSERSRFCRYPLRAFRHRFRPQVTTLLRLRDGRLVVHSRLHLRPDDVAAIRRFGEPAWLVEATTDARHFCARRADWLCLAFPISPRTVDGIPSALIHRRRLGRVKSRSSESTVCAESTSTLFFTALRARSSWPISFFIFRRRCSGWPRFFVQKFMRLPRLVGISFFFRLMIRDDDSFSRDSMRKVLAWDFKQIVVAHREPIGPMRSAVLLQRFARTRLGLES